METSAVELTARIFSVVFPLVAIVGVGFFYGRKVSTDMSVANRINIDVFIPALIFSVMASKSFELALYMKLALGAALVVLGSGLLVLPVCRWLKVAPKTFVPPMMFNNSGNLGLPLMVLAFGEQALPAAVVMFLVENLLHFTVGTYIMDHRTHWLQVLRNPIIIATFLGVLWSLMGWVLPVWLQLPIDMLGQISIPLMLFALGVRMTGIDFSHWRIGLWSAVLAPLSGLLMALPAALLLDLNTQQQAMLILFGALPPAVLNYMISERYQQEPQLVAPIVLIGNMASLLIIPLTLAFLL